MPHSASNAVPKGCRYYRHPFWDWQKDGVGISDTIGRWQNTIAAFDLEPVA